MPFSDLNHPGAALRVCVDHNEGGRLSGLVYSQRLTGPVAFHDVGELLLRLDELLDTQNFPQAYQKARSFAGGKGSEIPAATDPEHGMPAQTVAEAHGLAGTFLLQITARKNATWQGRVDWLDGRRDEFESALELIRLLEERMG